MGKTVTIQQGDTLISIAHAEGIFDWQRIWDHSRNRALRQQRSNPQVLYEGDVVYVPDKQEMFKDVQVELDKVHTFRLKKSACYFSVFLKNEAGKPYAGCRYRLELGSANFQGMTPENGLVCHPVGPNVQTGELTLWRNKQDPRDVYTWTLQIGHLNPADTVSGAKQRLKNLGYHVGPIDENLDEVTQSALENFQRHMGLKPADGQLNSATRNALTSLHQSF